MITSIKAFKESIEHNQRTYYRNTAQDWLINLLTTGHEDRSDSSRFISFSLDTNSGGNDNFGNCNIEFNADLLDKQGAQEIYYNQLFFEQNPEICMYITGYKNEDDYYDSKGYIDGEDANNNLDLTWEDYLDDYQQEEEIVIKHITYEPNLILHVSIDEKIDPQLAELLQKFNITFSGEEQDEDFIDPSGGRGLHTHESVSIPKAKDGDCFKNVQEYLLDNDLPNAKIVHGKITNSTGKTFDHAWIINGNEVIDPTMGKIIPKEDYDKYSKEDNVYTFSNTLKLRIKTKNYGPWTDNERKQIKLESKQPTDPNLSDDILCVKKDTLEPLDMKEWQIDKIIGVIVDEKEIKKIKESLGGSNVSTDLTVSNVAIGSVLYVTALLKPRNNSTAYSIGEMGVLEVKVMNMYYGLSKLNQLSKSGKLLK